MSYKQTKIHINNHDIYFSAHLGHTHHSCDLNNKDRYYSGIHMSASFHKNTVVIHVYCDYDNFVL